MPADIDELNEISYVSPRVRFIGGATTGTLLAYLGYPFDKYKNGVMAKVSAGTLPTRPKQPIFNPQYFSYLLNGKYQLPQTPLINYLELADRWNFFKDKVCVNTIAENYQELNSLRLKHKAIYRGFFGYGYYKFSNTLLTVWAMIPLMEAIQKSEIYTKATYFLKKEDSKLIASALSGSILGVAETIGLPIDLAKFRCQTENITMKKALQRIPQEGLRAQYVGFVATAARNIAGSGGMAFGKFATYRAMGLTDYNNPSIKQMFISSMVANITRVVISHPFDLVKVRNQKEAATKKSLVTNLHQLVKERGIGAFKEGIMPKIVSAAKGTLFFFASEAAILRWNKYQRELEKNTIMNKP